MADSISSDLCMSMKESRKRKAEIEIHGDTQRLRPDTISSPTPPAEIVGEAGQSGITNGVSPPKPYQPPCSQTRTVPSSWKDVLKSAIWQLLPSNYPGLSATELYDRLRLQEHELLKHQCNLKSFQSAIYTALNEMMFVYVDKRRLKGARNHHQYIALQRTQGARTQAKERTNIFELPASADTIVLRSQRSISLEPQETKTSPPRRSVDTQTAPERTAATQSPSRARTMQTAIAAGIRQDHKSQGTGISHPSTQKAHQRGLTEETRNDVAQTQNESPAASLNKECDDKTQPSTPTTAPSINIHTRSEDTYATRDHSTSDDSLEGTSSNALVVRTPTVPLSSRDSTQKMTTTSVISGPLQNQGERGGAGLRATQQAPDQNSLSVKSSQTIEALCQDSANTPEGHEARRFIEGGSVASATASPRTNGAPTQQNKTSEDGGPVDEGHTTRLSCREQSDKGNDIKNAALMKLGMQVERPYSLKTQCEAYKREKMVLQASSQAKQAALAESISRANEDIAHFNELNLQNQKLQAQLSDSERKLADARRQTTSSRDVTRRKDAECQTHAASMAQLADDYTSADRDYQNELRSLGLG